MLERAVVVLTVVVPRPVLALGGIVRTCGCGKYNVVGEEARNRRCPSLKNVANVMKFG